MDEVPAVVAVSEEKVLRGVLGSWRFMSCISGNTEAWTTDGKPIDTFASSCLGAEVDAVVIEFSLFRVFSKKEFGDVSDGPVSWFFDLFLTFLLRCSIVLSSSVFDTEGEGSCI